MLSEMTERYELSLVNLIDIGEEDGIESLVELIHKLAYKEFLSRRIDSMWDWELRTKNMFINNHLHRIGDVTTLPVEKVKRLIGCGYTTKKEVYDVFFMYHLRLKFWNPNIVRGPVTQYKF